MTCPDHEVPAYRISRRTLTVLAGPPADPTRITAQEIAAGTMIASEEEPIFECEKCAAEYGYGGRP